MATGKAVSRFWDKIRLGDQQYMPDSMKHNKANNNLFALPLILGIAWLGVPIQKR